MRCSTGTAGRSWREISNPLDAGFCVRAVQRAIAREGTQKIFGTDQGCPFTAAEFPGLLRARGIKISMDDPAGIWATPSSGGCGAR